MDVLISLFYILFTVCLIYPPIEFVSAGFTIAQLFDGYLGSENINFIEHHMRRTALTIFIHSLLPLLYVVCLWCGGEKGEWLVYAAIVTAAAPLIAIAKINSWWHRNNKNHPIAKVLAPYAPEDGDWRNVASNLNSEFRSVDKVSIRLTATSKFVATESWLVKVCQYSMNVIRQDDAALVATATDVHNLAPSGEDELQFVNIEVIPARNTIPKFSFRVSTVALRELQPRLAQPVMVPDHLTLQPTLIERFVTVFKQHIQQNPVHFVTEELELCIGCMQTMADVKLEKRCHLVLPPDDTADPPCQQCNCRALWCAACMARWWAARARGAPGAWLAARGSCPLCRAAFCLLDVCAARPRPAP